MLTVDVRVNGRLVAEISIRQIAQHEGHLRDYRVMASRKELHTEEIVLTDAVTITRHDRSKPVWDLLSKAMGLAK